MSSTLITPGYSGKKPGIERPGVESFQRSFPQDPGKFFTPFCNRRVLVGMLGFSRTNSQPHPYLEDAVENYSGILAKLGQDEDEISAALEDLAFECGSRNTPLADANPTQILEKARTVALELYKTGQYDEARGLLERLIEIGYEVLSTLLHLARIALITDDLAAAQTYVAVAWTHRAEAPHYVVGRILWFQVAFAQLDGASPAPFLGRLKTALQVENAHLEWTMDPVLAHLQPKLSPEAHALLTALVTALRDPANLARLDDFPEWHAATPLPLA